MKKNAWIALALALVLTVSLVACGENTAPEFEGVQDLTVQAGTEINVMEGVTAKDKQDGDLTAAVIIDSTPMLSFDEEGKTTPVNAGEYELVYMVTDKGGLTAEAYATLTVTRQTGAATVLTKFDFDAEVAGDAHGWKAEIGKSAKATGEMKQGAFVFEIADPGNGDGEIRLTKTGFALKKADYKVKVWAKSTTPTYAHLIARDEKAAEWTAFGGAWNARIEESIAPIELNFTSAGTGSAELMLNLGKITPNPDNAADTTPKNFTVTIDKIEIYEITGEETRNPLYTSKSVSGNWLTVDAGDGAAAKATVSGDKATAEISAYPKDGGVWSIKANIALGGLKITEGEKYYYTFTVNASGGVEGECLVESAEKAHEARANFAGIAAAAGEDTVIAGSFTAESSVDDPVIRLQIGNAPAGVTANQIVFSNVEFGKLEGDREIHKTIDSFAPIGKGTAAEADGICAWQTFNGTDEDNDRGVGTIWLENGSLFYRIDNGGNVDWHNKLIAPVTLPADSYFTVEITAKASKPCSCGFFLNPAGGWDPRISEEIDFTTEEQTFTFTTTDSFVTDMDVELLFQFGSAELAELGEVTIELTDVTIYQMPLI